MKQLKKGVYLHENKKGNFRLIYPIKKEPDKPYSINNLDWFNLITGGGYGKLFKLVFVILMILILAWTYHHDIEAYQDVFEDPCKYCQECKGTIYDNTYNIEMPDIEINKGGLENG